MALLTGGLSAFASAPPALAPGVERAMVSTWSASGVAVPREPGESLPDRGEPAPSARSFEQAAPPSRAVPPPTDDAPPAEAVRPSREPSTMLHRRPLAPPPPVTPATREPNWIEAHLSPPAYDRAAARVDARPSCDRRDPSCSLDAWGVDSPSGRLPPAAMMYAAGALASEVVPPIGAPNARTGAVQFSPGAVTFRKDF